MPGRTEAGQFLGVVRGALRGRPYTKEAPEFFPSEYPKGFPPNPEPEILLTEIKRLIEAQNSNHLQWDFLPWSPQRINIHALFRSLASFTDDHTEIIHQEYFPVDQSIRFIEEVIAGSKSKKAPLPLTEQLSIDLK